MSEPSGYLLHGTAFSSKEAAFEILVHNHEQELRFHKLWGEDAQPYYFEPQPQLTIPKSIADMMDAELNPLERESMLETFMLGINYLVLSDELMKFVLTGNNYHVISAYLAGKALGVDLVKVTED
ncbi:hypothetical protein KQH98_06215 [Lactococcus lactis]|uniref:hypothetical protein n=1 Tax=Lactococcus lactis TaxID=1358 RepID=UPI001C103AE8|nr:hypothetical protein [Lactococcus lactis]MBU5242904.1 hypothetical protein [Lactococcus lactis]